jgi:hypothetical protein
MRPLITLSVSLVLAAVCAAQDAVPPRFDVLYNPDLYKQVTPQDTVKSVLTAIERDRYDYIVAHLLDPAFVDARLATTRTYFERVGADQVAATAAGATLKGADLENRVRDVGARLNFLDLASRVRKKLNDEPDNIKDLRRFARDGQFQSAGDTATATLKDVKDRALYFKLIDGRWFIENRKEEAPAAPKE